jgi:hypothetical protein
VPDRGLQVLAAVRGQVVGVAVNCVGGLEQFDQVASGVGEQDLTPSGPGNRLAEKRQTGATESVDLGVKVLDDEMDAVAARAGGVCGRSAGAGTGGSGQ